MRNKLTPGELEQMNTCRVHCAKCMVKNCIIKSKLASVAVKPELADLPTAPITTNPKHRLGFEEMHLITRFNI